MTTEELDADIVYIRHQFEVILEEAAKNTSSSIAIPTTSTAPRPAPETVSNPARPLSINSSSAPSSPQPKPAQKKDTVEGKNASKMGAFFQRFMGDKKKAARDDSDLPASGKATSPVSATSQTSNTSNARSTGPIEPSPRSSSPPKSKPTVEREDSGDFATAKQQRRREVSRSWGDFKQNPENLPMSGVNVALDEQTPPNTISASDSSPISSAPTSRPSSMGPVSSASSTPRSEDGSVPVATTNTTNNKEKGPVASSSSDAIATASSSQHASSSTPNTPTTPNTSTANMRLKRRAAVFQKNDTRAPSAELTRESNAASEPVVLNETVNIWEEPVEGHIIFATAAKPTTPAATATAAPSNQPGARETVMLSEEASPATAPLPTNVQEVHSASLNQLVKHLTKARAVDGRALQTFLLTYTSFTTPKMLVEKLVQRYNIPKSKLVPKPNRDPSKPPKDMEANKKQKQLRVINFLRKWVDLCFLDFNEDIINTIFSFCEQLKTDGQTSLASLVDNALAAKMSGLAKRKLPAPETQPPPVPIMPRMVNVTAPKSSALTFLDIDPVELARQITLIDYHLFGQIRQAELLNQSWNKPKLKHRSPHVLEMIQRFNVLSNWLCCVILHTENLKDRVKVFQRVAALGKELLVLNNFNGIMAVLSAVQNSAVYRLNLTKEGAGAKVTKTIQEWSTLMDTRQNSANYKAALAAAKPPAVPYLGHYLSALTFIEEGNQTRLPNGLINFKKCSLVSKVIVGLLQYQIGKRYNLVPVDIIKEFVNNLTPGENDDELYELSLKREPRQPQPQP